MKSGLATCRISALPEKTTLGNASRTRRPNSTKHAADGVPGLLAGRHAGRMTGNACCDPHLGLAETRWGKSRRPSGLRAAGGRPVFSIVVFGGAAFAPSCWRLGARSRTVCSGDALIRGRPTTGSAESDSYAVTERCSARIKSRAVCVGGSRSAHALVGPDVDEDLSV